MDKENSLPQKLAAALRDGASVRPRPLSDPGILRSFLTDLMDNNPQPAAAAPFLPQLLPLLDPLPLLDRLPLLQPLKRLEPATATRSRGALDGLTPPAPPAPRGRDLSALKQTFTQWTQNEATALAVVDSLAMRHGDGRSTLPSTQERLGAWAKDTLTNYRGEGRPPFDLVGLLRVLTEDRFPAPTGAMASPGSMEPRLSPFVANDPGVPGLAFPASPFQLLAQPPAL